jgi:enoyl-CoA hydratase/carnithine racemase
MAEINQRLFQFSKLSLDLNKEIPMNSPVSYEIVDSIGVITVDNPPVNALSHAVREGILDAIHVTKSDESRAVVILCAGRTFIAGADITEFGKPPLEPYLPDLLNEIEASEKVVIAALHGTVLGGGFETALACHYRIALDSAKVGSTTALRWIRPRWVFQRSSWACSRARAAHSAYRGSRASKPQSN